MEASTLSKTIKIRYELGLDHGDAGSRYEGRGDLSLQPLFVQWIFPYFENRLKAGVTYLICAVFTHDSSISHNFAGRDSDALLALAENSIFFFHFFLLRCLFCELRFCCYL